MTTHIHKRCGQCGIEYAFQGSGYGCNRPENDSIYCPSCKTVINEALAKVPRRWEMRMQNISELGDRFAAVTPERVREWEAADERRRELAPYRFIARRVFSPLFNLETGETTSTIEVKGRDGHDPNILRRGCPPEYVGITFRMTWWNQKPEDCTIEVPMEYDLREGRFTGQLWQ